MIDATILVVAFFGYCIGQAIATVLILLFNGWNEDYTERKLRRQFGLPEHPKTWADLAEEAKRDG